MAEYDKNSHPAYKYKKMHTKEEKLEAFSRLLDVMDRLRKDCPWDRKQTNESLRPNTIEETYELSDALLADDTPNICKELGDVLLHIVFYSKMADEKQQFDIADVCNKLCDKLIYRHPHVYGNVVAETAGQVLKTWEQLKLKEKGGNKSTLSGVPSALPSLIKAYRIQEKASNVGFDWKQREDVWAKVHEEIDELRQEMERKDQAKSEAELGDFIFSLVNAARLYGLDPDSALEQTNRKFIHRFDHIEDSARQQGKAVKELSLEEMDRLWEEAKKTE